MRINRSIFRFLVVISGAIAVACGSGDPTIVDRPPVVKFDPENAEAWTLAVGDTQSFWVYATDPDETPLDYQFSLNDSLVSRGAEWTYVVDDTGHATVKCVVSDGSHSSWVEWQLFREVPINFPPEITAFAPIETNPVMILGDELAFTIQAVDPDDPVLRFIFSVNDSLVGTESDYLFLATATGHFDVKAVVTDGEHGVSREWSLNVTPVPDTIPPAEVNITLLETGAEPGELDLEWIAVGADSMVGLASTYHVRTSPAPIVDEESWTRASERPNVPQPALPGEQMSMVLTGLLPARFTYIAVRAEDNFGNLSPMRDAPGDYTRGMRIAGRVMDARTGEPMPDAHIDLAHYHTRTDANGEFEFIEMPILFEYLHVSEDFQPGILGTHYDYRTPYSVTHLDYIPVYLIPELPLETSRYDTFLMFFVAMTYIDGMPYPNHQRRWDPPIDLYATPFRKVTPQDTLDYQALIHTTVLDLNQHIGTDLFNVLGDVPQVGVTCIYNNDLQYDNYGVRQWSPDWYPLQGEAEFRTVYTAPTQAAFQIVIRHELGHALGLNHSVDDRHLMVGGVSPQVPNFTPDELAVIDVRYHIPRGIFIAHYIEE